MTTLKTAHAAFALRLGLLLLAAAPLAWAQHSPPAQSPLLTRPGPSRARGEAAYKTDEVLVRFKPGVSKTAIEAAHGAARGQLLRSFTSAPNLHLVRLPEKMTVREALRAYRANPDVLYAQPNYIYRAQITPNDPQFSQMWGLHNTGQAGGTVDADIDAPEAWDLTTGSSNVVVVVIDTGVDHTHPDLSPNMIQLETNCSDGVDNDGNGFIDDCRGIDTFNGDTNPFDDAGHGTHVSGTIGARGNNGMGVVGVNWIVQLAACKFLGSEGFGFTSGAVACLDYVALMKDRGVNIVATNNSWGGGGFDQALFDAIDAQRQRGILFVAAAGNAASNNDASQNFPSNYYLPNLIGVAASTRNEELAGFTNFGRHRVHLAAPGQEILSTTPNNTYNFSSGTSMATPHVTGVAALLKAQDPSRDWIALKNLILAGGDNTAATSDTTISGKRLNARGAMTCAGSTVLSRLRPVPDTVGSIGEPIELAMLHINCAASNGNVQVTVQPGGNMITLFDDGIAPDQVAGDGIYSGLFTPAGDGFFTLDFPDNSSVQVLIPSSQPYYLEGFEGGPEGFTAAKQVPLGASSPGALTWQLATNRGNDAGHSPVTSFYFGHPITFTYNTGLAEAAALTSPPITLGPGPHLLAFNHFLETEDFAGFDFAAVYVVPGGGTFDPFTSIRLLDNCGGACGIEGTLEDNTGEWRTAVADLSAFAGQTIRIVFFFDTVDDIDNFFEGWYVDDVIADGTNLGLRAHDSPAQLEGESGTVPFDFAVALSRASQDTVTVNFATADGTATAPGDYTPVSGMLTFMPGETSKTVTVMANGDSAKEPDETFFLDLSGPSSGVISIGRGTGVILRDEPNTPPVANAGPDQILQAPSDSGVSVQFNGSASSDADGDSLTFTWTGPFGTVQGQNPTVTMPIGINAVTLVVHDGIVNSASDELVVFVSDYFLLADPPSRTVFAGQSATFTVNAMPRFAPYNSAVSLACGSPLPRGVTCTFSPSNMLTPGSAGASVTLTITTTATRVAALERPSEQRPPEPFYALWLGLLGLAALMPKARGKQRWVVLLLALAVWTVALAACGGGGSSTTQVIIPGTPTGSHAISVNATSGSLQRGVNVQLVVQ